MKTKAVSVGLGVAFALALGACDSDDGDQATAVCVDQSGARVPDYRCGSGDNGMSGFEWYYIMSTLNQPRYGAQVVHNSYYSSTTINRYAGFKRPDSVSVARGVPASGWRPSGDSKAFVPKSQSNISPPKVIQQAPKPMFNPKPAVNPAPRIGRVGR